jgi:membrane-bound lytic murein transglycosylase B
MLSRTADHLFWMNRYNWSSYYALAVIELGQAVAQAMPH